MTIVIVIRSRHQNGYDQQCGPTGEELIYF